MDATNKRRENLSWPDQNEVNAQLEAVRELAKELRTDYLTDSPDEPTNWSNKARNRRNALIRAQFLEDGAFSLISGSEWLELFDLLGFSVDKETRKRFASHLNWYSFWYADFKPRLSSKYAQRIHWYVQNFLFCLRNKLQTEKDYREGKYDAMGREYFMEIEQQSATPIETPQISTGTKRTTNHSTNPDKPRETARKEQKRAIRISLIVHNLAWRGQFVHYHFAHVSKMAPISILSPPGYVPPIRGDCKIGVSQRAKPPNRIQYTKTNILQPS